MIEKPIKGQTLYSLNIGNAARNQKQELTKVEVVKVGRKYFTCRPVGNEGSWNAVQFHISDWRQKTEYSADSCLYSTKQEWEDEKESHEIRAFLAKFFRSYNYFADKITLENLRKIKAIIEES